MLGLAALGGQFPNIKADTKVAVGIRIAPNTGRNQASMDKLFGKTGPGWFTTVGNSGQPDFRDAMGRMVLVTGK